MFSLLWIMILLTTTCFKLDFQIIKFCLCVFFRTKARTTTSLKPICEIGFICLSLIVHPYSTAEEKSVILCRWANLHQILMKSLALGVAVQTPFFFEPHLFQPRPKKVGVVGQMAKLTYALSGSSSVFFFVYEWMWLQLVIRCRTKWTSVSAFKSTFSLSC
jgi:hypothetical protein